MSVDVRATKTLEHVPSFSSLLLREKTDARARTSSSSKKKKTPAREREEERGGECAGRERERERELVTEREVW